MHKLEIRRLNLFYVINTFYDGNVEKFSRAVDMDANYLRRLRYPMGHKHHKGIGDVTLDRILRVLNKPPGWLDVQQWEENPDITHLPENYSKTIIRRLKKLEVNPDNSIAELEKIIVLMTRWLGELYVNRGSQQEKP